MNFIIINAKTILYSVAGIILGLYVFDSFRSLSYFILSIVLIIFVCATAHQICETLTYGERDLIKGFRDVLYVVAIFVLFGVTWLFAGFASASIEPGDEIGEGRVATQYVPAKSCEENRSIHLRLFALLVAPTLIGVRFAVGPRKDGATGSS